MSSPIKRLDWHLILSIVIILGLENLLHISCCQQDFCWCFCFTLCHVWFYVTNIKVIFLVLFRICDPHDGNKVTLFNTGKVIMLFSFIMKWWLILMIWWRNRTNGCGKCKYDGWCVRKQWHYWIRLFGSSYKYWGSKGLSQENTRWRLWREWLMNKDTASRMIINASM